MFPSLRSTLGAASLACVLLAAVGVAPTEWLPIRTAQASHPRTDRHAARRRSRGSRARPRRATGAYRRQVARWHRRAPRTEVEAWAAMTPPPVVFRPSRGGAERFSLTPRADGLFGLDALQVAEQAFASRRGATHAVHPRLALLAHRIALEFRAPYLWLISGYRETRSTSRHAQGRAMDIVVPGVPNARLARFVRRQGFVGVGEYPESGFVHVDVRERSYFWVDASAPGAPSRERQVRRRESRQVDLAALDRGEEAVSDGEPSAARPPAIGPVASAP